MGPSPACPLGVTGAVPSPPCLAESTAPAALQTQDGPAVSRGTAETQPPGAPRVRSQAGPPPRRMLPWAPFGLGPEQRIFITFV